MHKIKKYANRKLYDTTDKTYISLERLSELIKAGEEVQIIDNTTGEEITASIISQLLAREKKEKTEQVPTTLLIDLLRKGGGTVADYAKKYASLWQNAMNMAEDEVDKLVKLLVKDKELSAKDGSKLKKEIVGYADNMKQWISERVDRRIKEVLGVMKLATREQVSELAERIDALSLKIEQLEKEGKKRD